MSTEFITSSSEHWYPSKTKEGLWYPSVTTILSKYPKGKQFENYLANLSSQDEGDAKLQAAADRGTNVHKGTELLELGHTIYRSDYTLEEWNMLMGFVAWHQETKPEVIEVEKSIVSDKFKTGGTIDRVYRIDGVVTILDIKTSAAIYDSYWCQTACYLELYNEGKKPADKAVQTSVLRLTTKRKSGYEFVIHEMNDIKKDIKVFKAVKEIWDYENPKKQPKIVEVPDTLVLINTPTIE